MKIKKSTFSVIWKVLLVILINISSLPICQATNSPNQHTEKISQKIIIHNVTFIDSSGEKEPTIATLLIKNKLFDLVTLDEIDVASSDIIFDAQNGFLLGTLSPGKVANFLILNKDPHKDIEVLLDTKKHILLAIRDGVIIRNNLKKQSNISSLAEQKKSKAKRAGWLAYSPPPMVIPSNYKDADWIKFDNDYFSSILIGALALDRQRWKSQDEASLAQVGDLQSFDGGEIRALRFGFAGVIKFDKPWVYMITGATNTFGKGYDSNSTDNVSFMD